MSKSGKKACFLLVVLTHFLLLAPFGSVAAATANFNTIFHYSVFYYDDNMDFNPGIFLGITGEVHGNRNIYVAALASLTFSNEVEAAGNIISGKNPASPLAAGTGPVNFLSTKTSGTPIYFLPSDATSQNFNGHALVEVPPVGESSTTGFGTNRLYNQVDMIITITNSPTNPVVIQAKSGIAINGGLTTTIPWTNFLSTNLTFYDFRQSATIQAVTLDIGKLKRWSETNSLLRPLLGNRDVTSVFLADVRAMASTNQSGIVITNGKFLPSLGLTIVTPNPVFTLGDFNTTIDGTNFYPGTNDTSHTRPAAIMCDAINILSSSWNPGAFVLATRIAASTTVNAAIVTGNVTTTNSHYSGGVENFFRFLEDWSFGTFTYNGSMIQLFASRIATAPWVAPGPSASVYNPPVCHWNFDRNFLNAAKVPPLTFYIDTGPVPLPTILADPQSTNVLVGSSLTLSVFATNNFSGFYATTPLTNQWYFNTNTPLTKATNNTLILTNIQLAQAGVYHVMVSNAAGGVASAFATVTVTKSDTVTTLGALPWSPQFQPLDFSATVTAASGTPTGQVEFKDGVNSLGSALLISGTALLNNINLSLGNHTITAYYSGDAKYNASSSSSAVQRLGFYFLPPILKPDGTVSLGGSSTPGQTAVLEHADALQTPMIWLPLDTNTADTNGRYNFIQPISGATSSFYRLRLP